MLHLYHTDETFLFVTGENVSGSIDRLRVRSIVQLLYHTRLVSIGIQPNYITLSIVPKITTHEHYHDASHIFAKNILPT